MKQIIFIPPDGEFKKQDFSLQRIAKWLEENQYYQIETILIYKKPSLQHLDISMFDKRIEVNTKSEILSILKKMNYDVIFHRAWMTCYLFAAELVKDSDNVIVNIKDWNFASKDMYEYLYPNFKDHEAIEYIFKNANKVLSHFTYEQIKIWAKEYETNEEKFIFFPEYCNESALNIKPKLAYENISLVYAGSISSTIQPEDYFPGKAHLRSIRNLCEQGFYIDFVLPENVYDYVYDSKELFKDFLFEDFSNTYFNIVRGKALDSSVLNKYHFGFFELETSGINIMLYKYAITSKFAFYLEAGLPILINEKFVSISHLVKKHNLGIVFNNKDLKNMKNILNISQEVYTQYVQNIKTFRTKFLYENKAMEEIIKYE